MSDPLGAGTFSGAVTDVLGLVTTSYVPQYVVALVAATSIGVGIAWLGRGLARFKRK